MNPCARWSMWLSHESFSLSFSLAESTFHLLQVTLTTGPGAFLSAAKRYLSAFFLRRDVRDVPSPLEMKKAVPGPFAKSSHHRLLAEHWNFDMDANGILEQANLPS